MEIDVANRLLQRAVLYARVSTKEQDKEGFSNPAQQKLLRGYASSNRFTVDREFIDVETLTPWHNQASKQSCLFPKGGCESLASGLSPDCATG